jgi:hypothetical protein
MSRRFDDLEAKVDTIADAHAEQFSDLDQRVTRLESKAA